MARRAITQFYDDLDNTLLEQDNLEVVRFSFGGKNYLLDLSRDNAAKFREMMQPYVDAARIAPETDRSRINQRDVREWARTQGIPVAKRGKIAAEVIEAYTEATAR